MARLKIRYLQERDGRPRWEPGPKLRAAGFRGQDLKDAAGAWLSRGDAILAAEQLNAKVDAWRQGGAAILKRGLERDPQCARALWDRYTRSSKFTELGTATQADYKAKVKFFLDGFAATVEQELAPGDVVKPGDHIPGFGDEPVAAIDKPHMHGFAELVVAQKGKAMGNGVIAVARRLLSYAELIRWRPANSNPAFRLELARPDPRLRLWTPAEVGAAVAAADHLGMASIGDAIVLALHSGQRQGDVLAMPDRIVDDTRILLSQFKTSVGVNIKITPPCAGRMADARARKTLAGVVGGTMIVHEGTRQAYNAHTFRHLFAEVRAAAVAGIPEIGLAPCPSLASAQFLDLRDTAVTRLALADCSKWQIASITGHSFTTVDAILKHYLILTGDMADAGIDRLVAWMEQEGIAL